MAENTPMGDTSNGEKARETAEHMKERLRARASAAGDRLRERADVARGWARARLDNLQGRVEANPYRAGAWALGLGFVAGMVFMGLMRSRR